MNRDRMERLAAYLRHLVPAERFKMQLWADGPLEECGTAGCAGGWATVLFREEGLRLENVEESLGLEEGVLIPVYQGQTRVAALEEFLDIGYEDSRNIFLPSGYGGASRITPAMVADRIEEILHYSEERR